LVVLASRLVYSFFFFSSRRRHTRSKRDWSSDVCSSDLQGILCHFFLLRCPVRHDIHDLIALPLMEALFLTNTHHSPCIGTIRGRSEERRVGKECKARGGE